MCVIIEQLEEMLSFLHCENMPLFLAPLWDGHSPARIIAEHIHSDTIVKYS